MAIKQFTIEVNATANLSANGTNTATGSMSWNVPAMPAGVSSWDSVAVSGSWAWTGKQQITNLTIDGKTAAQNTPFNITIAGTSPIVLTCKGNNKNATGATFSWTNLKVIYKYSLYVIEPPVITILSQDKEKIGVADMSTVQFNSTEDLQYWEARAVIVIEDNAPSQTPHHGVGLLIESGTNLPAGQTGTVYAETSELTNGDGMYQIDIYGQSTEGLWSDD